MFGRRKKNKRARARRTFRKIPRRTFAPVEDIVEQGMLVADVAVRMSVKNAIIMNALKRHLNFNWDQIVDMTREATVEVAKERESDAAHISRVRGEIRDTGRSAWRESSYKNEDSQTLRHRQEVYELVAEKLHERAADAEWVEKTAEKARNSAWEEIGDSLKERASHPYYAGGSSKEYQAERAGRIQKLIERDLTELVRTAGEARRHKEKKEKK